MFGDEAVLWCELCNTAISNFSISENTPTWPLGIPIRQHMIDHHSSMMVEEAAPKTKNKNALILRGMDLDLQAKLAADHHLEQFGDRDLVFRALKLAEEAGEVAGQCVRQAEQRDGLDWTDGIKDELQDVITCVVHICNEAGISFKEVVQEAVPKFLDRTWNVKKVT